LLALSFVALHTRTFGARSSGRALPFPRGCARDLLSKPRLPASRAALRTLSATSLHDALKSRSQATLAPPSNTATQCLGNPVTRPRACPAERSLALACEAGSRGFLSVARRTGKPPLRHTTARAVYGLCSLWSLDACSEAAPPRPPKIAGAICWWAWLRLDALPPTAARSAPRQRQHQPTNKESNQSVSGSERKPAKRAEIAAERGERSQSKKKIHGAR
jgi:hypothetical protein